MATETEIRESARATEGRFIDVSGDARALRDRTADNRDAALHNAAEIERKYKGRHVPDAEWQQLRGYVALAEKLDAQLAALNSIEANAEKVVRDAGRIASGHADFGGIDFDGHVIVREKPIYGPGSDHSFYKDLVTASIPEAAENSGAVRQAQERLDRHGKEQRSADPERARRADLGTAHRAQTQEVRAMTSTSSSGGSFVTPIYDVSSYGIWNSYPNSIVEQCTAVDDPGHGLVLYIPSWTSASATQAQTENTGVEDSEMTGAYLSATLETIAGEVTLSQELYDRMGPDPVTLDKAISAALRNDLDATVDAYVATAMIAVGTAVTGQTSFTANNWFGDLANAQQQVATGAGVKLPATHAFMQPEQMQWLLAQSDPNGRPLTLPYDPIVPSAVKFPAAGGAATGFSGYTVLGSAIFQDGNIPNVANTNPVQAPVILCNASETFVLRSEPCVRVVVEAFAPSLSVVVQQYQYCAAVVRHATSIAVLEANYLLASPSFA